MAHPKHEAPTLIGTHRCDPADSSAGQYFQIAGAVHDLSEVTPQGEKMLQLTTSSRYPVIFIYQVVKFAFIFIIVCHKFCC